MNQPAETAKQPRQWSGYGRQKPGKPFVLCIPHGLYDAAAIERASKIPGLKIVVLGGENNA